MKRLFYALAALVLVLVVACSGLIIWALLFEVPFLSYTNLPFPPTMKQVSAGDVIPLMVKRCSTAKTTRFYGVTHDLVSIDKPEVPPVILRNESVAISPGCIDVVSRVNAIPKGTEPGVYYARGLGIVEGTLRTFAVPWHSQPFEVVP